MHNNHRHGVYLRGRVGNPTQYSLSGYNKPSTTTPFYLLPTDNQQTKLELLDLWNDQNCLRNWIINLLKIWH